MEDFLLEKITHAAREMRAAQTETTTLDAALAGALDVIPGLHTAGVTLVRSDGTFETVASTDELVRRSDHWQYQFREGPCLQAIRAEETETVRSDDLRTESRWPRWAGKVAHELGVMSRQVVGDSADWWKGSDGGVGPVVIVEVDPAWQCRAARGF